MIQPEYSLFGWIEIRGSGQFTVLLDPSDQWIASGSDDHTVRLWATASGRSLGVLLGHTGSVRGLAVTADGSLMASASDDHTVRLWNMDAIGFRGGRRIYRGHEGYVYDVAFDSSDPTGRRVASVAWDATLRQWDAVSGETSRVAELGSVPACCLAYSPDGSRIAVGSSDRQIRLLDGATGQVIRKFSLSAKGAISIAFSPDGKHLAATQGVDYLRPDSGSAKVWEVENGREVAVYNETKRYLAVMSPNNLYLAITEPNEPHIIDAVTGKTVVTFKGQGARINRINYSADGTRFLTASDDGTVGVWNSKNGALVKLLKGHSNKVYDAKFSPDNKSIVSGSNDNTVRIWDAETFEQLIELRGHERYVYALAISSDSSMIVSASGDHTARIWDSLKRNR